MKAINQNQTPHERMFLDKMNKGIHSVHSNTKENDEIGKEASDSEDCSIFGRDVVCDDKRKEKEKELSVQDMHTALIGSMPKERESPQVPSKRQTPVKFIQPVSHLGNHATPEHERPSAESTREKYQAGHNHSQFEKRGRNRQLSQNLKQTQRREGSFPRSQNVSYTSRCNILAVSILLVLVDLSHDVHKAIER